jgi:hypothetical protein
MKGANMSHVATIQAEIKSLESLKAACKRLGLEFKENQKTYTWFGRHVGDYPIPDGLTINDMGKCLHAIKVPNAEYEVGVIKDPMNEKNYSLVWDFWNSGGLQRELGKDAWKLTQAYTVEHAKYTAKLQGKTVREKQLKDRIQLVVEM